MKMIDTLMLVMVKKVKNISMKWNLQLQLEKKRITSIDLTRFQLIYYYLNFTTEHNYLNRELLISGLCLLES